MQLVYFEGFSKFYIEYIVYILKYQHYLISNLNIAIDKVV